MDAFVKNVIDKIARHIHPDRVILFGSRAGGKADSESDLDLLILYSGPKSKRDVQLAIHRLFEHPAFSLDIFVMTPEEFECQQAVANTLAREVAETGTVCYG